MKTISYKVMFMLGAAAGVGTLMGLDALNKNKYQVKKKINDAIDQVANKVE
ncbi:MAG: hypothetical protein PHF21_01700 [Bacilli bacterium]|nr:hypothetical protein [Bacilli bacterium]